MFCLLICCGPKQDDVEAKLFSLEKVLTLDTENNKIAEMGLTDISYFDIDSEGKIFIANLKAKENYIFILNKDGSLVSVFGSIGQGPGELKTLDSSKIESFKKAVKVNIIPTLVYWEKSDNHIFTGNTEKYEIRVFDFDGKLVRSIKKEYESVLLSDKDREEYEKRLQKYPPEIKESFFIPDAFPPFRDIVALGGNWLFIQTYDEPNEGSSKYDIFDTNGEFAGRTELEGYQVKFKGDRVYCLKQKDSGYKELVVYQMIWD